MARPLLSLRNTTYSPGGPPLLDNISLEIFPRERVCLIGRNGSGKTTLLKLLMGELKADAGERFQPAAVQVAALPQDVPTDLAGSIEQLLEAGAEGLHLADWEVDARIHQILEEMELSPTASYADLSIGMKRRALLGRCLVQKPDLLLLDEPTNHLDIEAIAWMENYLLNSFSGALLFITHDRAFLQSLATRILDLDRGNLTSWDCDYRTYLERKEAWLEGEARQEAIFDKKLAQEEAWLRRGIKARRTRNEGRKRALMAKREERSKRREREGTARMQIGSAGRSGALVINVRDVSFAYDNKPIIQGLNFEIERGAKVGIIGPNGAGKSTLLHLLLGELQPQEGTITHGTKLQIAWFDQLRSRLNDDATVRDAVADGQETVQINGQNKHVVGYLEDFLFSRDRIRGPVRNLSGGERNRLLLARLFTQPCNVLVMDEPTNDLDMETLDLLEDLLVEFDGTLLVVSHDRAFLDNVATDLLVMEGNGHVLPIAGGYEDYQLYRKRLVPQQRPAPPPASAPVAQRQPKAAKLLNRERWELERLPREIEALEGEQGALTEKLGKPETYRDDPDFVPRARQRLHQIEESILEKFARWEALDQRRKAFEGDEP